MNASTLSAIDPVTPANDVGPAPDARPAAILRGSQRGLEIVVDATAPTEVIALRLIERLTEAPAFFRGSDVRVRVEDGPLAAGCLAKLDEIATRFELRIVEVGAPPRPTSRLATGDGVPQPQFAAGSAPTAASAPAPTIVAAPESTPEAAAPESTPESSRAPAPVADTAAAPAITAVEVAAPISAPTPAPVAATPVVAPAAVPVAATPVAAPVTAVPAEAIAEAEGTRVIVGPIRSGVILEHDGHVFIFGDVNPGAEVRASGNIVVLGRLRGTAHAGIGREVGFILAHCLEPQQLRIGRQVARASDKDAAANVPEIAHVAGAVITVEPYQGRLPRNLASSI